MRVIGTTDFVIDDWNLNQINPVMLTSAIDLNPSIKLLKNNIVYVTISETI